LLALARCKEGSGYTLGKKEKENLCIRKGEKNRQDAVKVPDNSVGSSRGSLNIKNEKGEPWKKRKKGAVGTKKAYASGIFLKRNLGKKNRGAMGMKVNAIFKKGRLSFATGN